MINANKIIRNILGTQKRKVRQNIYNRKKYKRDEILLTGGYCDASIYKFIIRINRTNYKTNFSCSGLISEHSEDNFSKKNIFKYSSSYLSFKNGTLKLLNVAIGTKWVGSVMSHKPEYDQFSYVQKKDLSNKIFIKTKLLSLLPKDDFRILFNLPSNLSEQEILHQWELITRNIENFKD